MREDRVGYDRAAAGDDGVGLGRVGLAAEGDVVEGRVRNDVLTRSTRRLRTANGRRERMSVQTSSGSAGEDSLLRSIMLELAGRGLFWGGGARWRSRGRDVDGRRREREGGVPGTCSSSDPFAVRTAAPFHHLRLARSSASRTLDAASRPAGAHRLRRCCWGVRADAGVPVSLQGREAERVRATSTPAPLSPFPLSRARSCCRRKRMAIWWYMRERTTRQVRWAGQRPRERAKKGDEGVADAGRATGRSRRAERMRRAGGCEGRRWGANQLR